MAETTSLDLEHQPYVIDRFFRGELSRNRDTGGLGLGLAIVKGIVEAMGGTIQCIAGRQIGAMFEITLPSGASDIYGSHSGSTS